MLMGLYPIVTTLFGNELFIITDPNTSDPANNVSTNNLALYIASYLTVINAVSNIGNLGAGVAVGVLGNTAEFNNIASSSSKLSLTLDNINHNILLDVVPANININTVGGTPLLPAGGGTGVTTSTGTGSVVLSNSPTLVTPNLGAANATSLIANGTAGSGFVEVPVATAYPALGAVGSSRLICSSPGGELGWVQQTNPFGRFFGGILTQNCYYVLPNVTGDTFVMRTDTATLTNKTINGALNAITNISLTAGVTGTLPVANGGTGVTTSTGTGSVVLSNSPSLVTPTIGAALATSVNFGGSTLNTYVTGTFTPVLAFGGASVGITYATQSGVYTQIGNVVHFIIRIVLTAKGTSTGSATISGLPVTINASYNSSVHCAAQNIAFLSTSDVIAYLTGGGTSISLVNQQNNNIFGSYTQAQVSNTTDITISGFYLS